MFDLKAGDGAPLFFCHPERSEGFLIAFGSTGIKTTIRDVSLRST